MLFPSVVIKANYGKTDSLYRFTRHILRNK